MAFREFSAALQVKVASLDGSRRKVPAGQNKVHATVPAKQKITETLGPLPCGKPKPELGSFLSSSEGRWRGEELLSWHAFEGSRGNSEFALRGSG